MDLNEDDVIQIIRYLDESNFNELRLQIGDLRIVVNRTGSLTPLPELDQASTASDLPTGHSSSPPVPLPAEDPPPRPAPLVRETLPPVEEPTGNGPRGTITSPMLGTFYRAPAPGEPPFVEVGTMVVEDTTVCIIEGYEAVQHHQGGEARPHHPWSPWRTGSLWSTDRSYSSWNPAETEGVYSSSGRYHTCPRRQQG